MEKVGNGTMTKAEADALVATYWSARALAWNAARMKDGRGVFNASDIIDECVDAARAAGINVLTYGKEDA